MTGGCGASGMLSSSESPSSSPSYSALITGAAGGSTCLLTSEKKYKLTLNNRSKGYYSVSTQSVSASTIVV